MSSAHLSDLDKLLARVASGLDIASHVYEDATLKYEDVGEWLGAEDSELLPYKPEIFVQGSFRLGTVVRPISDADEYDIDLVCHLGIKKEQITQNDLKIMVGDRLKKRDDLERILNSSRRCWTLEYPSEDQMPRFHMDVLPAIPNIELPPTGILLTDTELRLWQRSNPIAYSQWFHERMKVIFQERRVVLAEEMKAANVEEVPEWQVKTPLQIAVQILKRHRDIYFQSRQEVKPVSIIITTLAARAYENQPDVYEALDSIVRKIAANWGKPGFVENRNGRWWVANPVDSGENFADKWNEYPERRAAFLAWLRKVQSDITSASSTKTLNEAATSLAPVLGSRTVVRAAQDLSLPGHASVPMVRPPVQVPALGDYRHCRAPQWPVQISYKADVTGTVHLKQYAKKKLWDLTTRPAPKKVWLRFSVNTNVPRPYDIRWQVVNTGREAAEAGQLRGVFYESDKGLNGVRWESTSYAGTHWVEAFILKDGICVARSGRKYVKIR